MGEEDSEIFRAVGSGTVGEVVPWTGRKVGPEAGEGYIVSERVERVDPETVVGLESEEG